MLGTMVNAGAIILGAAAGAAIGERFSERYRDTLFTAVGMIALVAGAEMALSALKSGGSMIILLMALALGGVTGTFLDLHERMNRAAGRFASGGGRTAEGVVTAVLLFCVGTLSIVGPMKSALQGDHSMLYLNASMDFITALALGSAYGYAIMLTAPVLVLWQGTFYLGAWTARGMIPDYLLAGITGTGGILIMMSSLGLLNLRKVKTSDFLPALLWAPALALAAKWAGL
ncbi:DUF554 domain-containing protein [Succinimonas sp.]|uniref:DUF554 domain-containing protein n=1 Tax=Succinimonas sp. TaxID=1936151 RepID=UPI003863C89F